jgi:hypothetical protein
MLLIGIVAIALPFTLHFYSTRHANIALPPARKPISDKEAEAIIHERWGAAISLADEQRDPVCDLSDTHSASRYKHAVKHISNLSTIAGKRFPDSPELPPIVDPAFSCEGFDDEINRGEVHSRFKNLAERADKLEQAARLFEDALGGKY